MDLPVRGRAWLSLKELAAYRNVGTGAFFGPLAGPTHGIRSLD